MGAGDLAGKLQSQDYDRQSELAQARDRINMFNTQNAQGVQSRNVAAQNRAGEMNWQYNQDIANRNVDMANKEQQFNKGLQQQKFENEMQKANAKAGVYGSAAGGARQDGAQRRQAFGALGAGIGQMGSTIQADNNWNEWLETAKKKKLGAQS